MGKTAELTVVQKTIIDTLQKEGKPQTFITKEAGCSQSAVSKHVNRKLSRRKSCFGTEINTENRDIGTEYGNFGTVTTLVHNCATLTVSIHCATITASKNVFDVIISNAECFECCFCRSLTRSQRYI